MAEVVALGHATVDHLGVVRRYPSLDRKEELLDYSVQGGGPAATAAATLARLGVPTAFLGKLSDDPDGRRARESLEAEGVDCSGVVTVPGLQSPVSFIAVDRATGKRTIFWTRGAVPPLRPEEVDPSVLEGARLLLIDGHQPQAQARLARAARDRGLEVLLDAGSLRAGMEPLLELSTVVVASERFGAELAGAPDRAVAALQRRGARVAVVTLGEDGAVGRDERDAEVVAAWPVEVVDTTGAGDVYHGAFAYGVLQGWPLRRTMDFAACAAAYKCRSLGGRAGLPDLQTVLAALDHGVMPE